MASSKRPRSSLVRSFVIYGPLLLIALAVLNAVTGTTMQEKNNKATQNTNSPVVSTEISSLTSTIQDLQRSANRWDTLYIRFAGAAVSLGVIAFFFQFVARNGGIAVREAQERLLGLKDAQLVTDLRNKDFEISRAKERAATAENGAGKANERAGKLEKEAADTRSATAKLQQQNLITEAKLIEANKQLAKEQAERLELEKSIAPRNFVITLGGASGSNFEELRPFAGTKVVLEVLTDVEARRAANEISNLLSSARWHVESINPNPNLWMGYFDGVSIVPPPGSPDFPLQPPAKDDFELQQKSKGAANALALWLVQKNWKATVRNSVPKSGKIPSDTVKIFVGFKPNPFFDPDFVKESDKRYEEMLKKQNNQTNPQDR